MSPEPEGSPPPSAGGAMVKVALFIGLLLVASFSVKMCVDTVRETPARMVEATREATARAVRHVSSAVQSLFQVRPEVRIDSQVIQTQSAPIAELALVGKNFPLKFTWRHEWLGSTKEIQVSGTFRAKAGFDLDREFLVQTGEGAEVIRVQLPRPEVLTVELGDDLEMDGKSGFWNRISDEDRNQVMADFQKEVRVHIRESDILEEAERQARERLEALTADADRKVILKFSENLEKSLQDKPANSP